MLAVRLPSDIEKRLAELARATGRTKTFYIREAILEYLDDLEDIYLAEKRLGNYYAGKSQASSIGEVERELGLVD
jgi:RHH-type rel operon transcriptional repressor/antitoxin RelB